MKIGINLMNFGPAVSPDSLSRWARLVEALGYHLVMISDHVAVTPDVAQRYPAPFYDPFIALAWLAGQTHSVELGTTVTIVPYRSPLLVARMCSNLDQISNGRLIFGVGVGWAREEFKVLGVPFEHRGAMTNDYLAAIKVLWTNEVATYQGRFVSFENVSATPMPVRSPHPPIWVGGSSDAALLRAVRFGDAWHPIRFQMDWVRDTALPQLRRLADAERRPVPAFCPRIKLHLTDAPVTDRPRTIGEGTLSQVRSDLEELEELGTEYVLLDTYMDDPEATNQHEPAWQMITTLATQVLDLERESLR